MCDEATRLAKIGRQEYDLIRLHDAPNSNEQTKFECDLELARFQVIRSQMALASAESHYLSKKFFFSEERVQRGVRDASQAAVPSRRP